MRTERSSHPHSGHSSQGSLITPGDLAGVAIEVAVDSYRLHQGTIDSEEHKLRMAGAAGAMAGGKGGSSLVAIAMWILMPPPLKIAGAILGSIGGGIWGAKKGRQVARDLAQRGLPL